MRRTGRECDCPFCFVFMTIESSWSEDSIVSGKYLVKQGRQEGKMAETILEMKHITKIFPGVKALNNVNLKVMEGEIHALVGENGAGKSTLMNILSGVYPYGTYQGEVFYEKELCRFRGIRDSEERRIVIIHQELALIPYMTIGENMFLGNERGSSLRINWAQTHGQAEKLLKAVGLKDSSRTLIKDIGVGKQQLVEIAKALAKKAKLLILDEPTASLNEAESKALLNLLLQLKQQGLTSVLISHKLNEVAYVADKITILRDGATIETLDKGMNNAAFHPNGDAAPSSSIEGDNATEARIIRGMVGRELSDRFPKRGKTKAGAVRMEVQHWTVHHPLYPERKVVDDVSLTVREGEVLGISGLMGAGRTELAMSIFGKSYGEKISGTLYLNGKPVRLRSVRDAILHRLAYVTEDRKGNGLILNSSIKTNTTLANLKAVSHYGIFDKEKEYGVALSYREKLNIKCPSVEQHVGNLSGGNQQKVLLAKWMFTEPDILILDEPTRGIDVGAKYEIYCIINQLAAEGKSVILISSELPEVLGMSDRIYIMNEGRIVGELDAGEATQEAVMARILLEKGEPHGKD